MVAYEAIPNIVQQNFVVKTTYTQCIINDDRTKEEKANKGSRSVFNYFHKMAKGLPKPLRRETSFN